MARAARRLSLILLLAALPARAQPRTLYPWRSAAAPPGDSIATRFSPPPGAARLPLDPGSFGEWLRHLPLRAAGSPVRLFDGRAKARQDVHAAVVDLPLSRRDLQQCADTVMRLWAEYLYGRGEAARIAFHPEPGRPRVLAFRGQDRVAFERYLVRLFAEAGTASLAAELAPVSGPPTAGDLLIQGGYPGHVVMIVDVVADARGRRSLLLAQGFMPAQELHVLRNLADPARSPWYEAAALEAAGLRTPEWRPFRARDLRRFRRGSETRPIDRRPQQGPSGARHRPVQLRAEQIR